MRRTDDYRVLDVLAERYSPRSFSERPVSRDEFGSILEAGRLSLSCFNGQPWATVYAHRENSEDFERILSCLVKQNRLWAGRASVLMITAARVNFAHSGRENRHAWHDVGLWTMSMLAQGMSMGIYGHPMAGFLRDKARELMGIPDTHVPVTALAFGYPANPDEAPEELREQERERTPRMRIEEFAFPGRWRREAG